MQGLELGRGQGTCCSTRRKWLYSDPENAMDIVATAGGA